MANKRHHFLPADYLHSAMRAEIQQEECNLVCITDQVTEEWFTLPEVPSIAVSLKEGRTRFAMSQQEVACATGVNQTEISRIEAGKISKPSRKVLAALSPYMGLSYTRLQINAGYSDIYETEVYYSKGGDIIPHEQIVADIYKADPDLLTILKDIDILPRTDVELIKQLIFMMKCGIAKDDTQKKSDNSLAVRIQNLFSATKKFLSEQLSTLIKLSGEAKSESQHA